MRVLAVDGGASTTRALIADASGRVLGWGKAGPSNHLYGEAGRQRLKKALTQSITGAIQMSGASDADDEPITCTCLGMTGIREGSQEERTVEETLRSIVSCDRVLIYCDFHTALVGASGGEPGVLVYSGTGSVGFGINPQGASAATGGWGHLIDDEGSGYWIGLRALNAAYRDLDGRGDPTVLRAGLLRHFGVEDMQSLFRIIYENDGLDRPSIARLTVVVSEAAEAGDAPARRILEAAGRALAELAVSLARRLETPSWKPVVYTSGGVFRIGDPLLEPFRMAVQAAVPSAKIRPARYAPLVGGLLMALEAVGVPPSPDLLETIIRSAQSKGVPIAP